MCGILGYVNFSGKPVDRELFSSMTRRMAHRGPDDQGVEIMAGTPFVALGHRRLSIIDLSAAGHQPMSTPDGALWIVFNGEIYNFQAIRAELEQAGYRFKSHTDTEVILHAYREWGVNCLEKFNGMFAFAIWDTRSRSMFAARDRMGVKPFYYDQRGSQFCFGSEIKSMLGFVPPAIAPEGLRDFLLLQYVPWPNTLFDGIKKLPPAHYLLLDENGLRIRRYWTVPVAKDHALSFEDAKRRLLELLTDSIRLRLISDVPLGTFLSGGIDSAVITCLASRQVGQLNTYTIGFSEESGRYDETPFAGMLAKHVNARENVIKVSARKAAERIPELVWHLDEPVAESLIYPFFELSRNARRDFTVALSGEGSDEFLYGYRRYGFERYRRRLPRLPDLDVMRGHENLYLRMLALAGGSSVVDGLDRWLPNFSHRELDDMLPQALPYPRLATRMRETIGTPEPEDGLDFYPWLDEHFRLVDYLLTSRDKMSMAASLELRTPFLDFRLLEFLASVPCAYKIRNGEEKFLLKETFAGLLPDQIVRRRKQPFAAPIEVWLRPLCERFLRPSRLIADGVLTDKAGRYFAFDQKGKARYPRKLWNIVMAEIWYRIFIQNERVCDAQVAG